MNSDSKLGLKTSKIKQEPLEIPGKICLALNNTLA